MLPRAAGSAELAHADHIAEHRGDQVGGGHPLKSTIQVATARTATA